MIKYPIIPDRIHLFMIEGKRFAFDVHTCVVIEIDEPMSHALEQGMCAKSRSELIGRLSAQYSRETAESVIGELDELVAHHHLLSEDMLQGQSLPKPNGVATLCVNLSQVCNLRCRYCFAGDGSFGGPSVLMSVATAKQTIDFFLQHANGYKDLSLCFFGGEPLLNFDTMRKTVDYASRRAEECGKEFQFNITTNGTLLSETVRRFLIDHKFGVIVSIDGNRKIHDTMRPFADGTGSYNSIRDNLDAFKAENIKPAAPWTLRATFTRQHMNIADQVFNLADLGFQEVSVEPCISNTAAFGISETDIPSLKAEYMELTKRYLTAVRSGNRFSFFHFRVMFKQIKFGTQRLAQCGAGRGYLAVSACGNLYPCHRLVGHERYQVGTVHDGFTCPERRELFASAHVNSKSLCRRCWARYVCGGGCHACAILLNKDILKPFEAECELVKQRIEVGAYLYSQLNFNRSVHSGIHHNERSLDNAVHGKKCC
ncbi:MAG: SPASM domain-containing protein [Planctomycetota bacterium]|jgi:uncharacterized protein